MSPVPQLLKCARQPSSCCHLLSPHSLLFPPLKNLEGSTQVTTTHVKSPIAAANKANRANKDTPSLQQLGSTWPCPIRCVAATRLRGFAFQGSLQGSARLRSRPLISPALTLQRIRKGHRSYNPKSPSPQSYGLFAHRDRDKTTAKRCSFPPDRPCNSGPSTPICWIFILVQRTCPRLTE